MLAEQVQEAGGRQVPIAFELRYDPSRIVAGNNYELRARITVDGELRWINTIPVRVLTGGSPATGVTIMVEQVGATAATTVQPGPTVTSEAASSLEGLSWRLESYGAPGSETAVLANTEITAMFDKAFGRVTGTAGCNSYTGAYKVDGDKLTVSGVVTTLKACLEEPVMQQERAYLGVLESAESYRIENGRLQITAGGAQSVLNFVAQ